jgi:hypothetical protein
VQFVSEYVLAAHGVQTVAPAADHWPMGQIASVFLFGHEYPALQILHDATPALTNPGMQPSHPASIDCATMEVVLAGHEIFAFSAQ